MPVPETVYQGTTFVASIVCPQYPPDAWDGEFRLTRSGESDISLTGTDGGDGKTHEFSATPAQTSAWTAGQWNWAFLVSDGTDTFLINRGALTVEEINGTATELQSAKDTLADVRAALAAASGKPSSYNIKDRSLTNRSISELLQLESYWARRVNDLQVAADATCPTKTGNRRITYATFTR